MLCLAGKNGDNASTGEKRPADPIQTDSRPAKQPRPNPKSTRAPVRASNKAALVNKGPAPTDRVDAPASSAPTSKEGVPAIQETQVTSTATDKEAHGNEKVCVLSIAYLD